MKRVRPRADAEPCPSERLAAVASASRAGLSPADAWAEWGDGAGAGADGAGVEGAVPSLPRVSARLGFDARASARLALVAGIALADVLDALARVESAREEAAHAREVAAAGPRASARLLRWLPAVGLALAVVVEPGTATLLVARPLGWCLLGAGALLSWAGHAWMRSLAARASAPPHATELTLVTACALLAATMRAGVDVAGALEGVGAAARHAARSVSVESAGQSPGGAPSAATDEPAGELPSGRRGGLAGVHVPHACEEVAARLRAGCGWNAAWEGVPPPLAPLARALRPAWERGASPVGALDALAASALARERAEAVAAATELGVRLTAPVALCLLPAFVAVGIAPMIAAVAAGVVSDVSPAVASVAPVPAGGVSVDGDGPVAEGGQP